MNSGIATLEKPSGTINFYPYTFNRISKQRTILFQGGVPLHEIVYILYDFCLHYINNTSKNVDTYLSLIINTATVSRPSTAPILKLVGLKTKNQRKNKIKEVLPDLIDILKKTYGHFISSTNLEKKIYREDTPYNELRQSKLDFYEKIIPQLESI